MLKSMIAHLISHCVSTRFTTDPSHRGRAPLMLSKSSSDMTRHAEKAAMFAQSVAVHMVVTSECWLITRKKSIMCVPKQYVFAIARPHCLCTRSPCSTGLPFRWHINVSRREWDTEAMLNALARGFRYTPKKLQNRFSTGRGKWKGRPLRFMRGRPIARARIVIWIVLEVSSYGFRFCCFGDGQV